MKDGAWRKKRLLLQQREQLCKECPPDFADKLKSLDEALAAEENRHRLAVRNFKASRKTWEHIKSRLSRRRGG